MNRFLIALCIFTAGCSSGLTASAPKSAFDVAKEQYEFEVLQLELLDKSDKPVYDHYNAVAKQNIESWQEIARMKMSNPESARLMQESTDNAKRNFDKACANRKVQYNRVQAALAKVREIQSK